MESPNVDLLTNVAKVIAQVSRLHQREVSKGSIVSMQCAINLVLLDEFTTQEELDSVKRWLTNYI